MYTAPTWLMMTEYSVFSVLMLHFPTETQDALEFT